MNNQFVENLSSFDEQTKQYSTSRKSRSISRYFLGAKRTSMDYLTQDHDIQQCLSSLGIFDSCDLWTYVTIFRDYHTCRRLFILTNQNQLIIGKSNQKQQLYKIKHRIDLNRLWLVQNISETIISDITTLTYFDQQRICILGWPLAENFLIEFNSKDIRDIWCERIQSTLNSWWNMNLTVIEHVRVFIDQNQESDSNSTNQINSFIIRKVIAVRPQDTVRDLIKKCIDTSHLRDSSVDNYILYVVNDSNSPTNQTQLIPLIGHEYPYAIKMKYLKSSHNTSLDNDDQISSCQSTSTLNSRHYPSTTSLNNLSSISHDFELKKRDYDLTSKKHRFFPKRKPKENSLKPPVQQQKSFDDCQRTKSSLSLQFFGQNLDDLIQKSNQQLPAILQQLLEILYFKGPETTGIFRKVANARSVRESIDKIERNIPLQDDDLHPILAAGIFKQFLRLLPEPIFNSIQYENWKKCLRLSSIQERITFARRSIIYTLSYANHLLLKGFICVLTRISQEADSNGMNSFNLGLCVSNSLFKTESTSLTSGKQEADVMSSIVEFLIVNSSILFGSDVSTCIPDKHVIVHQIPNLNRPNASSIESLDEVESSPHLLVVNRSRDSGLATSDQPINDDSSEMSEHFRQKKISTPDWKQSIASGTGTVLTSIILPSTTRRNQKVSYKPSKLFLEREKLTNDTTDDESDPNDSSIRSSTTTVQNLTINGKTKRSKPISRHSSLGSNEQQQAQTQTNLIKRAPTTHDVKRTSSLKQFHRVSDHDNDDDDDNQRKQMNSIKKKFHLSSTKIKHIDEESLMTRSNQLEQQDLDLTSEPLSTINQRLNTTRSASFTTKPSIPPPATAAPSQPKILHTRSRSSKMHLPPSDRDRVFVHHVDSRPFKIGQAIQMKPIDDILLSSDNGKRRVCQRQNALRYKLNDYQQDHSIIDVNRIYSSMNPVTRHQSIERRVPMKSSDISWSVRETAKLFEQNLLPNNREHYV